MSEQLSQLLVQGWQMRLTPKYPTSQGLMHELSKRKNPDRHELHSDALTHFSQGGTQAVHKLVVASPYV